MSELTTIERLSPWVLRGLWIAVLISGGRAVDEALAGRDAETLLTWVGLGAWTAGVACMAIPAATSLTASRALVPLTGPVAVVAWMAGADAVDGALFVGFAVLATVVVLSSPIGHAFVQASAYGDEDRHLLRPPIVVGLVAVVAWAAWAGVVTVAVTATTRGAVLVAIVGWVVSVAGAVLLFPRWHQLTRRWLVLVPAGVVIHDHMVLAETLMLRRQHVAEIGLAPAGTDAADLTGPAPGHAIEIRTNEPTTVLLGRVAGDRAGTALHLTGCLIAPTRPGQALAAAARRRLPVGAVSGPTG